MLTRRRLLHGAAAFPAFINLQRKSEPSWPNFLIVITDDQRWDAMSHMGCRMLRTPNMDRLAAEGARFSNTFVTTSLCSPSRASYLTGQYVHRHGIRGNRMPLPIETVTFPRLLQQAGYDTGYFGKWHMGQQPERPGFNHYVTFRGQGSYYDPNLDINGTLSKYSSYLTDILTDHAVEWLKQNRTAPFLMYFGHKASHGPFQPAERHKEAFADVPLPRPASVDDTLADKPEWMKKRGGKGVRTDPNYENLMRNYYRTLLAVDESLGRVIRQLEEQRQLDNTFVLFTSDNGFFHGEHGLGDKRAGYDEALRIPFLVRYPALVKRASVVSQMALNIDVAPTILELARMAAPASVQGRSLLPLLRGNPRGWRTSFLYEYFAEPQFPQTPDIQGVRTERWKYLRYPGIDDLDELYDLKSDPLEMRNVVRDSAFAASLQNAKLELKRLLKLAA